jgi:hypothetical protein
MLTLKSLFAFFLFAIAVLFISCSDNSTNTNITTPANNDSLMYSFDSLVVYSDDTTHNVNAYYIYVNNCTITKFRVQCSLTSNDTSTVIDPFYSSVIVGITNNGDTTNGYYKLKIGKDINGYTINDVANLIVTPPYMLVGDVYLSFNGFPNNLHRFIRAKNFKLYKTS